MMRKISALFAVFTAIALFALPSAGEASTLGINVKDFVARMGIAFNQAKQGFAPEEIHKRLVCTEDGNYAAEYRPEIFLYLYVEGKEENINHVALSFTVAGESELKSAEGAYYESLCRQLIFALEEGATENSASEILRNLGLFDAVFDGAQRAHKGGIYTYMTRYYDSTIMLLIAPAL